MLFTSYVFIFYFLPLVLAGYYLLPSCAGWRNTWLLLTSYVFYGWWNPWFLILMLGMTAVNFFCARLMSRSGASDNYRFRCLLASILLSLGALCYFKYGGFFQTNLNAALAAFGLGGIKVLEIALPVGISFYTFHALSYTVDVYRGTAVVSRSFSDFACYIALFPQSIAGPIIRYHTVAHDLIARQHNVSRFASGLTLFILGFSKKILIANPLGSVADAAFGAESLHCWDAWFGVLAYALQIYFDFCGYSDMAVGLGRLFGFEFMKNFDAPYRAVSITDFWRRWHISLSAFLRDYLYIPLGGNRGNLTRTCFNLLIVMLLGGLWHGANWTFIAWGAYHGILLIAERLTGLSGNTSPIPQPLRMVMTFILVLGSWVIFRAESFANALHYYRAMLGFGQIEDSATLLAAQLYIPNKIAIMVVALALLWSPVQAHEWSQSQSWSKVLILIPLFVLALLMLFSQNSNPFLYFQF